MASESDNGWTLDGGTVMDYCGRDEATGHSHSLETSHFYFR